MRLQTQQSPDDLLDRAIAAVRATPVPDGPSQDLFNATLASLRGGRDVRPMRMHRAILGWPMRIAAVIVLAGAGVAIFVANRPSQPPALVGGRIGPSSVPGSTTQQSISPGPAIVRQPDPERAVGPVIAKRVDPPMPQPPVVPIDPDAIEPVSAPVVLAAAGSVRGRVIFDGKAPEAVKNVWKPTKECVQHHHGVPADESLVIGDHGGVANVVLSIAAGLPEGGEWQSPSYAAVLDQDQCRFVPHVVTMMVGQDLVARNSDPFFHNVRTSPANNDPANIAQPTRDIQGRKLKRVKAPDVFQVKCDVHPWMSAWVLAFEHPFYCTTDEDGSFVMQNLPPGRYTIRAWHEKLGVQEQDVTVEPGEPAGLTFSYAEKE